MRVGLMQISLSGDLSAELADRPVTGTGLRGLNVRAACGRASAPARHQPSPENRPFEAR